MSVVNTSEHSDNPTPGDQSASQTGPQSGLLVGEGPSGGTRSEAEMGPATSKRSQLPPSTDARQQLFPPFGRIAIDPGTRVLVGHEAIPGGASTVLMGGSPLRLMKLTGASEAVMERLAGGANVAEAATATKTSIRSVARLADRLLDAQLAHPLWDSQNPTSESAGDVLGTVDLSTVTLVIPVKDRAVQLRRLLISLQREMSEGLKVVVVDDGSTDASGDVAREFKAVAVLLNGQSLGPAGARNRGLESVTTPFVAFVDSDCTCTYGWLSLLLRHFADPTVALVAPRIFGAPSTTASESSEPSAGEPITRRAADGVPQATGPKAVIGSPPSGALEAYEAVRSPLDLGPDRALIVPRTRVSYVPSAALVARVDVLRALSGFSTDLQVGEDVDLLWRLHAVGWRSRYEPRATVAHDHRVAWRAFAKRRYQYGTSAALLDARHPGQVAPLAVSGWSALGWLGLCTLSPVGVLGGLGTMAVTTALLPRKLRVVANPRRLALDLAGRGHFGAGRQLASALWRAYLPLVLASLLLPKPVALVSRRVLLMSAIIPNVVDWRSKRPKLDPFRYVGIRLLDDASYCAGVWAGAVKLRSLRSLKPDFTSWPGKSKPPSPSSPGGES